MRGFFLFAGGIAIATPALANDSVASTGAGGLVLQRTADIDMASEDLFVSADQIKIHSVFRNHSPRDVTTIVAFPMPDRDLTNELESNIAFPSNFHTLVAGEPVKTQLERKAVVKGKDYTALLHRLGIPVAPETVNNATKAMDRLSLAQRTQLQSLGLARDDQWDDDGKGMKHHLVPLWTIRDKYWWTQRFPAGRDLVVDHRYQPGTGGSVENQLALPELRHDQYTKQMMALYCVDQSFMQAVDRLARRQRTNSPGMPDQRIDYILTTGANWRSPIASFRLVVDKGKPNNLVSFCETGVKKISPTQYEVRHSNWTPKRDLHVLIIQPQH